MGVWVLEEPRLRLNSAPVGFSLAGAGAGAELGKSPEAQFGPLLRNSEPKLSHKKKRVVFNFPN